MPQSTAAINQLMSGFAPITTGLQNTTYSGMENVPFMSNLGTLGMFASPVLRGAMGGAGFAPFGMHDVNVYDQMRDLQYSQAQMAAMANAARLDRENVFRTLRGVAAMSGTQFGAQQRRAAYGLADMTAYVAPAMAQMNPDMLDAMGGLRGSATLMTQRMMMAGRYRADPVTGLVGMTPGSASAIAGNVYSGLFGDDYRQMHGLTAGQTGDMFAELQYRGMLGHASGDVRSRALLALDQLQRQPNGALQAAFNRQKVQGVGDLQRLSGGDLDKMMLDPAVADRMRGMDAEKIKQSLKSYSAAVSAMRDIFGDMGRPNAPMRELMQGLDALTAGSSAWVNPAKTASIVRQTYNLSKQTGTSMDAAMAIQQHAASRADAMGLPPIFAIQAAQGGLGFGGAYRASGQAAHTAWGAFNADQITQADVNLRVQAAGSHMANRLGAVARLAEARGGFANGSSAANLMQAIRTGQSSFMNNGALQSVVMNDRQLFSILGQSGVSENIARDFIDQAGSNRQYIDQYGIGNILRREQGRAEVHPFIRNQMDVALNASLTSGGVNADVARRSVQAIGGRITQRMMDMDTATFAKTDQRTAAMARILEEELSATGAGTLLTNMNPEQRRNFLQTAASHMYGHTQKVLGTSSFRGLGGLTNIHRLFNTDTLAQADIQQQQAAFTSQMQEALSPLGRGSALARAMQFLQDTKPGDEKQLRSLLATAMGGVKGSDIQSTLLAPMQTVHAQRQQLLDLQSRIGRTTDPIEKARLQEQIDVGMRELNNRAGQLARIGETYGYYGDSGISREDTQRGIGSIRAVADSIQDLGSIRGGFGSRAFSSEIQSLLGTTGLSHAETAAVMLARKHASKELNEASASDVAEFRRAMSHQGTIYADDEHAKQALLAFRRKTVNIMNPDEVEANRASIKIENAEEARAVALVRRQNISPRATEEQIEAMRKQGLPDAMAKWAADQEQRALRFGITEQDITGTLESYERKYGKETSRAHAIHGLVQGRIIEQYNVTPAEIAEAKTRPGMAGKTDKEIEESIINARVKEKSQRFSAFFASPDAGRFREDVDAAGQFSENLSAKLVTPGMVSRFGTQALEWNKEMRAIQRRQQELAYLYAGGDMARLEAGDFTGLDLKTPEGRKKELEIIGELDKIRQRQLDIFQTVDSTHGNKGRQFRLGTVTEGYDRLMGNVDRFALTPEEKSATEKHRAWIQAGAPKQDSFEFAGKWYNYTKEEHAEYLKARERAREDVGDEQEARRLLGLPSTGTLSEENARKLSQAKYTVSLMRRLGPDDVVKMKMFKDAGEDLNNMAKRYGVSREDLIKNADGINVARLTAATSAEIEAHNTANARYRQAQNRFTSASDKVSRLEAQLQNLGGPANATTRANVERQLIMARQDKNAAEGEMKTAVASTKAAAESRGVDPREYLIDRVGFITPSELESVNFGVKTFKERQLEAKTIATSAGATSADDLLGYADLATEYEKRQKKAAAADTSSGMDIVARLNSAYGLGISEDMLGANSDAQKSASRLGSIHSRRLITGLADSQLFLRQFAAGRKSSLQSQITAIDEKGGSNTDRERLAGYLQGVSGEGNTGVDTLLAAYNKARRLTGESREKAIARLRKDFGMEADKDWTQFSQAADMQLKSKFSELGVGRSRGVSDMFDLITNVQRGGEGASGTQAPGRTEIFGTLKIIGDSGEINAATGGSMYSVPVSP